MKQYSQMTATELQAEYNAVKQKYDELLGQGLKLDMSRGKPGPDQLDLSVGMLDTVTSSTDLKSRDGVDCRNYGGLDGLTELKELFADILEVPVGNVIVGGNASLNMMFDTISQAMTHGMGGEPWMKQGTVKFLCPVPGYDRHFGICEYFGIEMINVPYTDEGPDMDMVEELIKDEMVKGMWCVPKYSNPDGIVYSDRVVKRLAAMKPAADDFRIFWDNAYVIHPIFGECDKMLGIYDECVKAGCPDKVIMFTSTSKITFPGAGVAAMAASDANIERIKKRMNYQTIGPDKLNHLRHARFLPDIKAVREQMSKHAAKMRPKFEAVLTVLDRELGGLGIARWKKPNGGYFISMFSEKGCAKRIVGLCRDAGLILTSAGATYPYGIDPDDSNIRIAPSFPSPEELTQAAELLCVATRLATLELFTKR
ncbi:MAG: aminotransferase class I/II-fold pyridoxal phosphate-dependent enzyme [Clostridia bacterium]|nr:aminotransferase class I/II-fold pyridoxal phosphate-dependent enzyme [Clostridia bacterium]